MVCGGGCTFKFTDPLPPQRVTQGLGGSGTPRPADGVSHWGVGPPHTHDAAGEERENVSFQVVLSGSACVFRGLGRVLRWDGTPRPRKVAQGLGGSLTPPPADDARSWGVQTPSSCCLRRRCPMRWPGTRPGRGGWARPSRSDGARYRRRKPRSSTWPNAKRRTAGRRARVLASLGS